MHEDQITYLRAPARVPGVQITQTYLRHYQHAGARCPGARLRRRDLASSELKSRRRQGQGYYAPATRSARPGVEARSTRTCAGCPGSRAARRLARPRRRARIERRRLPQPGNAVRLTIDVGLQRAAERALRVRDPARARRTASGPPTAARSSRIDPRDGDDPRAWPRTRPTSRASTSAASTRRSSRRSLDPTVAKKANYPGLNRAIAGLYPPGSTFKPVTALAAMRGALLSPYEPLQCTPDSRTGRIDEARCSRTGTRTRTSR